METELICLDYITYPDELNEEQREEFETCFYFHSKYDDRKDNPYPWGCPWFYAETHELKGACIEDKAYNFFEEVKEEFYSQMEE